MMKIEFDQTAFGNTTQCSKNLPLIIYQKSIKCTISPFLEMNVAISYYWLLYYFEIIFQKLINFSHTVIFEIIHDINKAMVVVYLLRILKLFTFFFY